MPCLLRASENEESVKTIRYHFSQEAKEATCVGILCKAVNSRGPLDFAGDSDLQAPFRNAELYGLSSGH